MGTTKKDNNKVDFTTPTNPLQEQGQKIDVVVNDKPDYYPTERIPKQEDYRKQNPFQNKQSESIIPYKEEVKSKTPAFDMQTMINDLNAREEEALKQNEEERKKESRYHRARAIISAIGDGLSGLANIYYARKGAPDMLKGTTSMSAKQQERWDKIRKEREARREVYLKAVRDNNRESLKNAYTQWKDNLEAKRIEEELELKRNKDARDEAKANYDAKIAKLNADLLTHKIDEAKYNADIAEAERNYANELLQAKIDRYNRTGTGRSSSGSGGSGSKNYTKTKTIMVPVRDKRGRIIDYEEREVTETKEYGKRPSTIDGKGAKMPGVK